MSAIRQEQPPRDAVGPQVESVAPQNPSAGDDPSDAELAPFEDATLSAFHEIGNSLTPLMLNAEMILEESRRSDIREAALQIFMAARRIAFTLRRLRSIQDVQAVAYPGQSRMLDLSIMTPPTAPESVVMAEAAAARR